MIRKLTIKNFKIHSDTVLELKNLNIFTGLNGVGKSSAIQSLLLLRQSYETNVLSTGLQLNRPHCDIGFIKDAIYQGGGTDEIEFVLDTDENGSLSWKFNPLDRNSRKTFIPILGNSPGNLNAVSLFNENFQYLSAARWSPRETYPLDTNAVETKRQLSLEKGQGELAAHFLSHYGKNESIKSETLKHPQQPLDDLLSQTTAWEREISPGVNVHPIPVGKSFTLQYSFDKKSGVTEEFSAENVGAFLTKADYLVGGNYLEECRNQIRILFEKGSRNVHTNSFKKGDCYYFYWNINCSINIASEIISDATEAKQHEGEGKTVVINIADAYINNREDIHVIKDAVHYNDLPVLVSIPTVDNEIEFSQWFTSLSVPNHSLKNNPNFQKTPYNGSYLYIFHVISRICKKHQIK